jgi:phage tail-like protein
MAYYPPAGFHFKVQFGFLDSNTDDARFQEVNGISAEVETEEFAEGGENRFSYRFPTRAKYSNLVLKRGFYIDSKVVNWIKNAVENLVAIPGKYEPTTVNVTLLNELHNPLMGTFSFRNAWPVKWSISDLKSTENNIIIETLELSYTYFTKIDASGTHG